MTCKEIMQWLEQLSPVSFAERWDNVGLLVGRQEKEVGRVMLCLDVTDDIIGQAIAARADMIVSHHPMIFRPFKQVTSGDVFQNRILKLVRADICVYAMHTNFDVMGMADEAAERLELLDSQVLQVTYEDEIATEGIGRVGQLMEPMTLLDVAQLVKRAFFVNQVKVFGNPEDICCTAAICPGSGKDLAADAVKSGADVFITGDIDHHTGIDLKAQGVNVIDAGHFGIEKLFKPYMKDYLARMLPQLEVLTAREEEPFWYV
ncbi:MAG: Nif3-like dinuclear metal center hexameric protein [Lachnospiraceae bacterium]|nr:Nif3-like dinuclear metal center hexameric protein [Lachnospiraceae bacterium]